MYDYKPELVKRDGEECLPIRNFGKNLLCPSIIKPCSTFITFITVTLAITPVCLCIQWATFKLKRFVKVNDRKAKEIRNMNRMTNTARIRATMFLIVAFIIEWVPYGISRLYVFTKPSFNTFQTVSSCGHALSTFIYVSIPIIYYKMDGKFSNFGLPI